MRAVSRNGAMALLLATTGCANTGIGGLNSQELSAVVPSDAQTISQNADDGALLVPEQAATYEAITADGAPLNGYVAELPGAQYEQVASLDAEYAPSAITQAEAAAPLPARDVITAPEPRFERVVINQPLRPKPAQTVSRDAAPRRTTPSAPKTAEPVQVAAQQPKQQRSRFLRWRKKEEAPARVPEAIKALPRVTTRVPTTAPVLVTPQQTTQATMQAPAQAPRALAKAPERRMSSARITRSAPEIEPEDISVEAPQLVRRQAAPAQKTRRSSLFASLPRIGRPSSLAAPQIANAPQISTRAPQIAPTLPNTARVARLSQPSAPALESAPAIGDLTQQPQASSIPTARTARPGKLASPAVPSFKLPSFLRRAPAPSIPAAPEIRTPAAPKLTAPRQPAAPKLPTAPAPQYVQIEEPQQAAPQYQQQKPEPQYIETQLAARQPTVQLPQAPAVQAKPRYVSIDLAPQVTPAPRYVQIQPAAPAPRAVQPQPRYVQIQQAAPALPAAPRLPAAPQYQSVTLPSQQAAPLVAQLQVGPARLVEPAAPTRTAALAPSSRPATSSRGTMKPIYDVPNTVVGDRGETRIHARKQFRPDLVRSARAPAARIRSQYSTGFGRVLERAALKRLNPNIRYDARYLKIGYPWGDVPQSAGVCSDVVIRSYRALGVDLQQLVHEDMRQAFAAYPSQRIYGLRSADPNIDHRRVVNLEAFFERVGASVPVGRGPDDYKAGDVVTWRLNGSEPHIGIVVEERDPRTGYPMVVHNLGAGVRKEDMISIQQPVGQYRFAPQGGGGQLISGLASGVQGG